MNTKNVSDTFQVFLQEAPEHSKVWMEAVQKLDVASSLNKKTEEIAYIAVMAAVGLESGIPFHVKVAKEQGATRDEIKSAVLIGLPAAGNTVIKALPIALQAFDE
ncbi:carboxymuconolactone decarboxylase family protein [Clostridium sp. BSD9I1]|uniref:carboxymuconolactone decarboxylase family protein n=1 Tax=Clostridium sp. BSD9I1 TaxID=2003589 RepID=UPI00164915A2|nr:carboxymuconolactone decarboxylase family protein [Clostridium sp. BSD9I1]